jgi:hypothetical protein
MVIISRDTASYKSQEKKFRILVHDNIQRFFFVDASNLNRPSGNAVEGFEKNEIIVKKKCINDLVVKKMGSFLKEEDSSFLLFFFFLF